MFVPYRYVLFENKDDRDRSVDILLNICNKNIEGVEIHTGILIPSLSAPGLYEIRRSSRLQNWNPWDYSLYKCRWNLL